MPKVTTYKCPSCNGPMHFSSSSQRLECDYCGSSFSIEEVDKLYSGKVEQAAEEGAKAAEKEEQTSFNIDGEAQVQTGGSWASSNMKAYNCSSCGAELICETITVSTSCPYCGNPTIIPGKFKQDGMPNYIIPFKLDKEAAVNALKNFYGNKKLLPKVFSKQNHIEEVKGVYIPFWLYDGDMDVSASFEGSNTTSSVSGEYRTTTIKYYDVQREANIPFEKVPVDASIKMDNAQMDSLEPFDFKELKTFSPSYLPGYFAEAYDDDSKNCSDRLKERVEQSAVQRLYASVTGYSSVTMKSCNVDMHVNKINYAFLPVWLLSTKWKNNNYLFAMNGQTGKLVGDLPMDKGKYWRRFIGIVLSVGTVVAVACYWGVKLWIMYKNR